MKTLLLCPELFAREGGIQRILRLYLKALCELATDGDEVRLVVLNDPAFPDDLLARYAGESLGARHACRGHRLAFFWRVLQATRGVNLTVCGHVGQLPVAWLAARLRPRLRYVLVAHGIEVWRSYSGLERRALRGAARILCVSEFTRGEMLRRTGLPADRFAVVPNALDPGFPGEDGGAMDCRGSPLVLAVARLDAHERYKGVDHLISALPAVRAVIPEVRLRIVGTGSDLARLRRLAHRLGVAEAVEFAGHLAEADLRTAYRSCSLFALPSRGEGFGIVYLEAMAFGKPCLGARAAAVPEIIGEDSGGLVEYGDVAQIAGRLVWALQHHWDSAQIQRRAAQFDYATFKARLLAATAAYPLPTP